MHDVIKCIFILDLLQKWVLNELKTDTSQTHTKMYYAQMIY